VTGLGLLVTESREILRLCSVEVAGKSQFETREKDFFFLKGGGAAWRISGSGGGGGSERSERLRRDAGFEEASGEGEGVVNAADASVNDFNLAGI
jgi:hypothetical protein